MFSKQKSLIALLVFAMLLLTACAQSANTPSSNKEKSGDQQELTIAIASDPGTLDPAVAMDNSSWKIAYRAYERLVVFKGESTEVKPGLAKSWSASKDGKTWTFELNTGHKFADGSEVDAEAVKYSFDRVLKVAKGPVAVYGVIDHVETDGDNKVIFTLKESFPPFLSTLAADYGGIVNPNVEKHAKDGDMGQNYLATHTMGSGPYQVDEWKKGQYIRLAVNENYPEEPAIKKVTFKIVADPAAQKLQLQKGEVDIAENIPNEQIGDIKNMSDVTLIQKPSFLVDYVYINSSKGNPALKDAKVRQALNEGIDYDALIKATQQGYATRLKGPIPDGMWGHDGSLEGYDYNPDHAKQLLKEAGVSNLELTLLYSDNSAWWGTEALTIQSDLAEIGVKVNLKKVAYATSRDMMDKGEFDLALGVWMPDFADPFMYMNYWYDSDNFGLAGNRAFYKNGEVDSLIRQAAASNDQSERERLYKEAQKIVVQDAPYIINYQTDFLLPINKRVKGFAFNPMLQGIYNLEEMSK